MRLQILSVLFALVAPGAALAFDSPRALVEAIYAPYQQLERHDDLGQFYSARLDALFDRYAERVARAAFEADAPPALGFDPFIDAEHPLLYDLKIGEPQVIGEEALITVTFHNFDHPSLLSLALVEEADGWKVDDVTSTGKGENWMLSWLLIYDPWDVK